MAQDVIWDTPELVLSEYKEITTLLRKPIKDRLRIKYTCFDVSTNYIALGSTSGSIYLFSRETCIFQRLLPLPYGAVTHILISPDEKVIALSTTDGNVCLVVFQPTVKEAIVSSEDKRNGESITALCWNDNGSELYIGDANGSIHVMGLSIFTVKRGIFQDTACPIMNLDYRIVQMDFYAPLLLISTISDCYICDTVEGHYEKVGVRARDGEFGACFYKPHLEKNFEFSIRLANNSPATRNSYLQEEISDEWGTRLYPRIYCARPGSRLWEAKINGEIVKTHHFKEALAIPPSFVRNRDPRPASCDEWLENYCMWQSLKFSPLHIIAHEYLFTYNKNALYILDHVNSAVILWCNEYKDISTANVIENFIYLMTNTGDFHCLELISSVPETSDFCSKPYPTKFSSKLESGIVVVNKKNSIQSRDAKNKEYDLPVKLNEDMNKFDVKTSNRQSLVENHLEMNKNNEPLVEAKVEVDYLVKVNDESAEHKVSVVTKVKADVTKDEISNLLSDVQLIYSLANSINNAMPDDEIDKIIKTLEEIITDVRKSYEKLVDKKPSVLKAIETAEQYYKNIFLSKISSDKLIETQSELILNQSSNIFIAINESNGTDCECGFPHPRKKLEEPKYFDRGMAILKRYSNESKNNCIDLCKKVPYMWRACLEIFGTEDNLFDERIFAECLQTRDVIILSFVLLSLNMKQWNLVIKLMNNLKLKKCLLCNRSIKVWDDKIDLSINWNDIANEIMKRKGPDVAMNFLTTLVKVIPSLSLNRSLFQSLIFNKILYNNGLERTVDFNRKHDRGDCDKYSSLCCPKVQDGLLQTLEKDLGRRLTKDVFGTGAHHWGMHYDPINSICPCCTLPLQTPVLLDNNGLSLFPCGHSYHVNCLIQKKILKCNLHI